MTIPDLDALVDELSGGTTSMEVEIAGASDHIADALLEVMAEALKQRDAELHALRERVASQDAQIAEGLKHALASRDQIAELRQRVARLEGTP